MNSYRESPSLSPGMSLYACITRALTRVRGRASKCAHTVENALRPSGLRPHPGMPCPLRSAPGTATRFPCSPRSGGFRLRRHAFRWQGAVPSTVSADTNTTRIGAETSDDKLIGKVFPGITQAQNIAPAVGAADGRLISEPGARSVLRLGCWGGYCAGYRT